MLRGRSFVIAENQNNRVRFLGGGYHLGYEFPVLIRVRKLVAPAVATAQKADTVILVLGDNEQTSREAWSNVIWDRASLELFGVQNELVKAVVETGKPIVVLLFNGRPNSIGYVAANIPAIIECWYLGQETGTAVADVLFGDFNPGGKLPISIPPVGWTYTVLLQSQAILSPRISFRRYSALYPFGYGLSYTSFSFAHVRLEKPVIRANESTKVLSMSRTLETSRATKCSSVYSRCCEFCYPSREGTKRVQEDQFEAGRIEDNRLYNFARTIVVHQHRHEIHGRAGRF